MEHAEFAGFDKTKVGQKIDHIPRTGTLTGLWKSNFYGCWWEYKYEQPDLGISAYGDIRTHGWLKGEHPKPVCPREGGLKP